LYKNGGIQTVLVRFAKQMGYSDENVLYLSDRYSGRGIESIGYRVALYPMKSPYTPIPRYQCSIDSEIERKLEFTAHGGNAANDIGAINGTAIPGVSRDHGSFDPNQRGAPVRAGDSDGLVQIAEEAFDADSFMIAPGSGMEADAEELTGRSEDAAKSTTSVDNDETTHADLQ
jgi:hypothetical protein